MSQTSHTKTVGAPTERFRDGRYSHLKDRVVVEEPLEIRVGNRRFTATMRTPGDDFNLTRGLLFTEGVIGSLADIGHMRYCDTGESDEQNIVQVELLQSAVAPHLWERNLISNSSCGLCGKASIEALRSSVKPVESVGRIPFQVLRTLPAQMRAEQSLFEETGGTHAAALFTAAGELIAVYEDIGRHNATDKLIGFGLTAQLLPALPGDLLILMVSGRASFEIIQKALRARVAIVAAVSAVSALAVELAQANNLTLIGFLRDESHTVYCGGQRIEGLFPFENPSV